MNGDEVLQKPTILRRLPVVLVLPSLSPLRMGVESTALPGGLTLRLTLEANTFRSESCSI